MEVHSLLLSNKYMCIHHATRPDFHSSIYLVGLGCNEFSAGTLTTKRVAQLVAYI
jgi:hypothetical protein